MEGEVGIILDTYDDADGPDFLVACRATVDLYECRTEQLTRITREEAQR